MSRVSGRRSPRWALLSWTLIRDDNGQPYLRRLRVIQTPWFGLFIHWIYLPDGDRDPHTHPWPWFWSFVARGGYAEKVYLDGDLLRPRWFSWSRWSLHRMTERHAHRITYVENGTITVVLTGPRAHGWGFVTDDGFVPWRQYEGAV